MTASTAREWSGASVSRRFGVGAERCVEPVRPQARGTLAVCTRPASRYVEGHLAQIGEQRSDRRRGLSVLGIPVGWLARPDGLRGGFGTRGRVDLEDLRFDATRTCVEREDAHEIRR